MIFHRLLLSSNNKIPFRPIITFPVNQEELFEFDLIEATSFEDSGGSGIHRSTQWQVATDEEFLNIVSNTGTQDEFLTSIPVSEFNIEMLNTYYVRVRYFDAETVSDWSDEVLFNTNLFEMPLNNWADSIFDALTFGFQV